MEYNEGYQFLLNAVKSAGAFIVPLYKMNHERKYPEFVGSSVYCRIGPFEFIFTAAHVLNDIYPQKPMYPSSNHLFLELLCQEVVQHKEQRLDIGIIQLKEPITMWKPLDAEYFSHYIQLSDYQHLLVGYPGSYTKKSDRERQISVLKGYLTSACEDAEYAKRNEAIDDKILVVFKKEGNFEENKKQVTFPNPNGMSGGAVIQFNENKPLEMKIVGIMNEWDPNKKNVIIATKIERYLELISIKRIDLTTASTG